MKNPVLLEKDIIAEVFPNSKKASTTIYIPFKLTKDGDKIRTLVYPKIALTTGAIAVYNKECDGYEPLVYDVLNNFVPDETISKILKANIPFSQALFLLLFTLPNFYIKNFPEKLKFQRKDLQKRLEHVNQKTMYKWTLKYRLLSNLVAKRPNDKNALRRIYSLIDDARIVLDSSPKHNELIKEIDKMFNWIGDLNIIYDANRWFRRFTSSVIFKLNRQDVLERILVFYTLPFTYNGERTLLRYFLNIRINKNAEKEERFKKMMVLKTIDLKQIDSPKDPLWEVLFDL